MSGTPLNTNTVLRNSRIALGLGPSYTRPVLPARPVLPGLGGLGGLGFSGVYNPYGLA